MLLWCKVIFFISVEEINEFFFEGVRKIFFRFGFNCWFILVNWNLYLKLVIVCRLWIRIVVFLVWVNFVSKLENLIMVILFSLLVIVEISDICFFRLNNGFLLGLVVIFIIILLNMCEVCLMRLVWLLVIGLKVLG